MNYIFKMIEKKNVNFYWIIGALDCDLDRRICPIIPQFCWEEQSKQKAAAKKEKPQDSKTD